jgi:hypothetical protein
MSADIDNVTLGIRTIGSIPCFLCSRELDLRKDKKQKPYFICDSCGMQVFIRRKPGINLLNKLLSDIRAGIAQGIEAMALSGQLIELNRKLKEIEDQQGIFSLFKPENELNTAADLIQQEIKTITQKIEKLKINGEPNDK